MYELFVGALGLFLVIAALCTFLKGLSQIAGIEPFGLSGCLSAIVVLCAFGWVAYLIGQLVLA